MAGRDRPKEGSILALLLLIGLGLGAGLLLLLWRPGAARPTPEPRSTWRLILPREARFGVAEATAWFTALAPCLSPAGPHLTAEFRSHQRTVEIRLTLPRAREVAVRGQLAAWLPGARLEPVAAAEPQGSLAVLPLRLARPDLYPLRVPAAKEPDPLLGLLGALTRPDGTSGVRITWGPAPWDWLHWAPAALKAVKAGQGLPPRGIWLWPALGYQLIQAASRPPASELAGATAKVRAPVFGAKITAWAAGPSAEAAAQHVTDLGAHLRAGFRDPVGNTLVSASAPQPIPSLATLDARPLPSMALSAAELAALFHLPGPEHPLLPGEISRRVAPPAGLMHPPTIAAEPITWLGNTLTPAGPVPFGLGLAERRLHSYVTGKTGTGKSTLLATIIRQDLATGHGVAVLDPHGDLAERILTLVPPARESEVIYFNPADAAFPINLNLLAAVSPAARPLVASGVIAVFKKMFAEFWGPRLEHTFRQALLALLETPTPTLLLLPRLLSDRAFREHALSYVRDPVLLTFFREEYERYDPRWRAEAISPILNKVGQFLATPTLRHVVGPCSPGLDLRQVMDEGRILVVNLATGRIGEDAAALLGGLLVSGLQLAAMARADQPEAHRRDFFLTIDEFQHFATDAFVTLLSEARKFRVGLTLSHQHLSQVPPHVTEALLGNVGSLAVFRVGAPDATRLVKELAPSFDLQDLVHLPNYQFCTRLTAGGETLPAFSGHTIPLPAPTQDPAPLIARSRRQWARPRAEVELEIADLWEGRLD